ncbi:S24 family peptidase [Sphingobacterium spiritivorum]|uniref:S24 family peptidase n=1 Tax=Sphingobacterium spiritivorum TaxID=258 RepID=UPI003DA6CA25
MLEYQGDKFRLWLDSQFEKDKKKPISERFNMKKAIEMMGVSKTNMYQYFKSQNLKRETVKSITETFNVSESEIWGHEQNEIPLKPKNEITPVAFDDYMMVEYVDLSASAGMLGGSNVDLLPETKKRLVPKEFEKGNYLVVRVNGDSMVDGTDISIPDGAEILVKEYVLENGDKLPIRGNLFVICSREGNVFKQVVEHNTDLGYIRCRSYNKKYADYNIPLDDVFQIFIYRKIVGYRPSIPEL